MNWWLLAGLMFLVFMYCRFLFKRQQRQMLEHMRSDGLTEQDIEDILGSEGYRKITSA